MFKLYHQEADSAIIESIFVSNVVSNVFLSELAKIEFVSTVWKKVRTGEITTLQANIIMEAFEKDYGKYTFLPIDNVLIEQAKHAIAKWGRQGLRTLDGIQLCTAVSLRNDADIFVSADKLLHSFLKFESLPVL